VAWLPVSLRVCPQRRHRCPTMTTAIFPTRNPSIACALRRRQGRHGDKLDDKEDSAGCPRLLTTLQTLASSSTRPPSMRRALSVDHPERTLLPQLYVVHATLQRATPVRLFLYNTTRSRKITEGGAAQPKLDRCRRTYAVELRRGAIDKFDPCVLRNPASVRPNRSRTAIGGQDVT
jgi:hypothetical protein